MLLQKTVDEAIAILMGGGVGVMPTDTVYGLVARAADRAAVKRFYALKHREHKPGTVVAASVAQLVELGLLERELRAVEQWWPNPLSVVISAGEELEYLHQGLDSLVVRVPREGVLGKVLEQTGPLVTSSANRPGEPTATNVIEAWNYFGDSLDFSFSGLKTAVLRTLQTEAGGDFRMHSSELSERLTPTQTNNMAASFQRTVCETLTTGLLRAYHQFQPKTVVIAGGVAANTRLREEVSRQIPAEMHYAPMQHCTDNGAMIASMGYFLAQAAQATNPLEFKTDPILAV